MSTASTKRAKKHKAKQGLKKGVKDTAPAQVADLPEGYWQFASLVILVIGAILRLYDLNLVPLHHDEGVNGNFLVRLVREGTYQYDPANYHGPTLYYFSAIIPWITRLLFGVPTRDNYGLTTFTIRLVPALFGLATIWLVLLLRRRLGTIGALSAAALLAVSPGAVYLSRYFIHETLFTFFTLAIVVALLRFYEEAHPVYLVLASASAALLFATKETAFVSAAVLLIAFVSTQIYFRLIGGSRRKNAHPVRDFIVRAGGTKTFAIWIGIAAAVFLGVYVLFYSSFFTNYPKGVYDSLKTFQFWTKTGKEAHVHPPTTYFLWLWREESPLLILGTIGALAAALKPRNTFALFSGLWAFGLIAAYTLISYKTPWLDLNFIVPLSLIAGYAFQLIWQTRWRQKNGVIVGLMAFAFVVSFYQMVDLNFYNYDNDDERYVYVYAHTRRGTKSLVEQIDRLASQKQGSLTGVTIVSPDYWPLPWYLRNYTRVGYFGRMAETTEPLIIASESQAAEVQQRFGSAYQQVPSGINTAGSYPLRPGVNLLLYAKRNMDQ